MTRTIASDLLPTSLRVMAGQSHAGQARATHPTLDLTQGVKTCGDPDPAPAPIGPSDAYNPERPSSGPYSPAYEDEPAVAAFTTTDRAPARWQILPTPRQTLPDWLAITLTVAGVVAAVCAAFLAAGFFWGLGENVSIYVASLTIPA